MSTEKEKIVILSAVRTPVGKFGGSFKDVSAVSLGAAASRQAIQRADLDPSQVDEVIFGQARLAGNGPNPARQILIKSGIPPEKTAFSVNMACGSGIKAITQGFLSLLRGDNKIVLVGGTENMSRIPYLLNDARWGYRLGNGQLVDAMYMDGLYCPLAEMIMGETAENLAEEYGISRTQQDEYALESQMKAKNALENGLFDKEITPVSVVVKKGQEEKITKDEHPRPNATLEKLAKLPAVFKKNGTVTAGNSSGLTDGAAALILTTLTHARKLGIKPLAGILDFSSAGVSPERMGLGPVPATRNLLKTNKMTVDDIDLIEINEAFAAQVLAVERELKWNIERRNILGGAIALGHPTGCTGAKITVTLIHSLIRKNKELGLATLCISGGQGMSLLIKKV